MHQKKKKLHTQWPFHLLHSVVRVPVMSWVLHDYVPVNMPLQLLPEKLDSASQKQKNSCNYFEDVGIWSLLHYCL